ncbi:MULTISPECIES: TonB-dependent receptor [Bacteria]|uniref:TonB-dependent receptor n=1 Tax=Bacteria TaxID=2 RepID=UPI001403ABC0|nr:MULTISPECIES: TonB-dependent receptor [Bacteria]
MSERPVGARRSIVIGLLAGAAILLPHAAQAQQAAGAPTTKADAASPPAADGDSAQGDIIVTAQKREQRLQDVGIAITALSGDALAKIGVRESTDITAQVPNLQNNSVFGPGTNVNFSIRGVSLPDFNDLTEAPVATYIDEIYLVPLGAGSFPTFDVDRVEVLRGPQGTLFGRNTTGGIVHFVTNKATPGRTLVDVEAEIGRFDTRRATAVVNVPLGAGFALRASGIYQQNDPWIHNLYGQRDAGELKTYAGRVQLGFDKGGPLTADAKFEYGHAEGATTVYHQIVTSRDPVTGLVETPGPRNTGNPWFQSTNRSPHFLKGANSYTGLLSLNYDFDTVQLASISGFNHYDRYTREDCDGGPSYICNTTYMSHSNQFSQELRLFNRGDRTNWTVGAYYLQQNAGLKQIAPIFVNAAGSPFLVALADADLRLHSYALFGNVEQKLTDRLTLIAGARVTKDVKDFDQLLTYFTTPGNFFDFWSNAPFSPRVGTVLAANDFNKTTAGDLTRLDVTDVAARLQLNYKVNNALLYASVSRGVKAGGFNNGFIDVATPLDKVPYKPELVYVYEAGVKSDLLGRRLTLNGSIFYYDYPRFQSFGFQTLGGFLQTRQASLYGAEVELAARPVHGLTVALGGGLLHTLVRDVTTPGPAFRTYDREMPLAPRWSVNGRIRYEHEASFGTIGMQADFKATAQYNTDALNNPATVVPSYIVANGRIDLAPANSPFRASFFVKNVFNRKYRISAFDLSTSYNTIYEQFAPPRWWGLSVGYRYDQRN